MNVTGSLALPGFFLSGFLFALLGALLPAWEYHLNPRSAPAGQYFLCICAGVVAAGLLMRKLIPSVRVALVLTVSCGLAFGSLLFLSLAAPPAPEYWRLARMGIHRISWRPSQCRAL